MNGFRAFKASTAATGTQRVDTAKGISAYNTVNGAAAGFQFFRLLFFNGLRDHAQKH
jgi:hypothetical protein